MLRKIALIFLYISYSHSYEYPKPFQNYYSQRGQDKFLNEKIFKGKRNGIFIEIGAHDGISFSNTYFFEKHLGWIGICIEPNPDIFQQLIHNRNCICEQVAIIDCIGTLPFLKCSGYMLEMYNGLLNYYDSRHMERIFNEMAQYGGTIEIIPVECITLDALFKKYDISHVDLLSIDIEGGEERVIKTIDFDTVTIDIILVENNFNEDNIKEYLLSNNYIHLLHVGKDDIYQWNKDEDT